MTPLGPTSTSTSSVGRDAARHILRLEDTRRCGGPRGNSTATGADVTVEPCDGRADQRFLIS
ncbi:RICIN domain-containing protein [Streptomyces sp. NPDC087844]|uniref:RICIN domain-containing protein n=1 Tax=Streptomyces sp. NPDC087844 TaxID=3365805 RepID=UPI003818F854